MRARWWAPGSLLVVWSTLQAQGPLSPNLRAGDHALFRMEEAYAATHKDLLGRVFLTVGEGEVMQGGVISASGIVSSMTRMAEILTVRGYPSLKPHVRIFPSEDHQSVIHLNTYWGLKTLLGANRKEALRAIAFELPRYSDYLSEERVSPTAVR